MAISLPQYLLESSICLASFFAVYHFLLRRETFFQLNRFYLLLTPALSFTIPLLNWKLEQQEPFFDRLYPIVFEVSTAQTVFWREMEEPIPLFSFSLLELLLFIYLLGAAWMAVRLLAGLWHLYRLIRRFRQTPGDKVTLLDTGGQFPAASFFSYIFWNSRELSEKQQLVMAHELVHVQQRHSIDVLLMETYIIFQWFNPLIYAFRKALRITHEYLADAYVAAQMGSPFRYATYLVACAEEQPASPLLHPFAQMLRERLSMLARPGSCRFQYLRYLSVAPLVVALMLLFSFDLAQELPAPLITPLQQVENLWQETKDLPVVQVFPETAAPSTPRPSEEPVEEKIRLTLQWAGLEWPLRLFQPDLTNEFTVISIAPEAFRKLRDAPLQVRGLPAELGVKVEAMVLPAASAADPIQANSLGDLQVALKELDSDGALLIRLSDHQGGRYFAVFRIGPELSGSSGDPLLPALFKLTGPMRRFSICEYQSDRVTLQMLQARRPDNPLLLWCSRSIPLHDVEEKKGSVPMIQISRADWQPCPGAQPLLQYRGQSWPIYRMAFVYFDGRYWKEVESPINRLWFDWMEELPENSLVYLVLKAKDNKVFLSTLQIGEGLPGGHGQEFPELAQEKVKTFSRRSATPFQIPKPVFRPGGTYLMLWDEQQFITDNKGRPTSSIAMSEAELRNLLRQPIRVRQGEKNLAVKNVSLYLLARQENPEELPESIDIPSSAGSGTAYLSETHRRFILENLPKGLSHLFLAVGLDQEGQDKPVKERLLPLNRDLAGLPVFDNSGSTLYIQIQLISSETGREGFRIDPSLAEVQLVTRPNDKMLVKLDTTNHRYRELVEEDQNGQMGFDILHIPGYQTLRRAVLPSEVVLPEAEIGRTDQLIGLIRDPMILPEFVDFQGRAIHFEWRGCRAAMDQKLHLLKRFQQSKNSRWTLRVGEEQLTIRQTELILVPESGPARRFLTDRGDHPEIEKAVDQLGPRSSVFLHQILVERATGELMYFPLTLVFHLN